MRAGPDIGVLMVISLVPLLRVLLLHAERRGWVRLRGSGQGSAALAFAAVEDMFAPSRGEARVHREQQRLIGDQRPAPGDPLDPAPVSSGTREPRPYAGRITLEAPRPSPLGPPRA